ncbi:MAG TPA: GH116 family glycosyl-hydrolase, partial [Fimbriimonadaceae bacterium]|nr:GH116 family glycosyl-hydrolase [Fimbriimonadaceae bacterium]
MSLFRPEFDLGPYTFAGEQLREIAFPLGGIGSGCVSLDGRLGLRDWEIYGRPNKGSFLEKTFPALWVQPEGEQSHALTVQGPRAKDWVGEGRAFWSYGHGQFFKQMDGLPGFDAVEFCGTFPMARARLTKKGLPVEVELAAFNPFIPLDTRSSSFPCACLVYRVKNLTRRRVRGTLAWSLMNPIGEGVPGEDRARNETRDSGTHRGLYFFNEKTESSAALTTAWKDVTILERWETGAWFDAVQTFWSAFREDGRLEKAQGAKGNPRSPGTLGCVFELGPGEEVEIPFLISWVVKPVSKYWGGPNEPKAEPWNPSYSTLWPTAWHAATEFHKRYEELSARTLAFERAMFQSTLPPEVLQSVSATASTLHSPTVIQLEDGTFWAWEGCSPTDGCCAGT